MAEHSAQRTAHSAQKNRARSTRETPYSLQEGGKHHISDAQPAAPPAVAAHDRDRGEGGPARTRRGWGGGIGTTSRGWQPLFCLCWMLGSAPQELNTVRPEAKPTCCKLHARNPNRFVLRSCCRDTLSTSGNRSSYPHVFFVDTPRSS
jgi:hypothetical protein